jgi:hypothetical protein
MIRLPVLTIKRIMLAMEIVTHFDESGSRWHQIRLWPFRRWLCISIELWHRPYGKPR